MTVVSRHTHDVIGKRRKDHAASRGPARYDVPRARESSRPAGLPDRHLGVGTQADGFLDGARTIDDRGDDHDRRDLRAHRWGRGQTTANRLLRALIAQTG